MQPSPRAGPRVSCARGSGRRRGGRARAGRPGRPALPARAGSGVPSASCASSVTALGRSTGTSTPWSERQPSSAVSSSSLASTIAGFTAARASSSPSIRNTNRRRSTPAWLPARPTPCASAISACMRATRRRRSSSKSSTSSALSFSTGSGHCRIWASASRRLASFSALSSSSMTWPCSSLTPRSVYSEALRIDVDHGGRPAFRIAGAAAASAWAARAARAPGRSVLATSCARWRPRSRRSGAGPSRSASPTACRPAAGFARCPGKSQRRLQLLQRLHRRVGLRPGDDDANQVTEGRIAECLAALQLAGRGTARRRAWRRARPAARRAGTSGSGRGRGRRGRCGPRAG